MRYKFVKTFSHLLLLLAVIVLTAGTTLAKNYFLQVEEFDKVMPNGDLVTMWGYNDCSDGTFSDCDTFGNAVATSPGPVLDVPFGSSSLGVLLKNPIGEIGEVTSLVIPGQIGVAGLPALPLVFQDPRGLDRVRSFTKETWPGSTNFYLWNNLKPGTYLYHSGSHPQVQVQMGLYGAVKKVAGWPWVASGINTAYLDKNDNKITYGAESILLFSEIDPALHALVADGHPKGTIAGWRFAGPSSTLYYNSPKYFLVNGQPFPGIGSLGDENNNLIIDAEEDEDGDLVLNATDQCPGTPSLTPVDLLGCSATQTPYYPVTAGENGKKTLLRMLNAGINTHVPVIERTHMEVIAEDGYVYPYPKEQCSLRIPALKTKDVIIRPTGQIKITSATPNGGDLDVVATSTAGGAADLWITFANGFITPIKMDWVSVSNEWTGTISGGAAVAAVEVTGLSNRYSLYDRRLNLTNNGQQGGGMFVNIDLDGVATLP